MYPDGAAGGAGSSLAQSGMSMDATNESTGYVVITPNWLT
jgi:hypothetical protein